ncbi:MAG: response regulator [Nitrospira sp.]|nr:response regulator [Nitrospira sp.]
MTDTVPLSILYLGPQSPLTAQIGSWLATHLPGPHTVRMTHTLADALEHLQAQRVDLVLLDLKSQERPGQDLLHTIHAASPTSALLALVLHTDDSSAFDALRRGAHEVLAITSSTHADACRAIARALARTGKQPPAFMRPSTAPPASLKPDRLIHDLNNLLTSINGFADLLLTRLAPQDPARTSAEHIVTAGKRAAALLKAHAPVPHSASTAPPAPIMQPPAITAKAA